MRKAYTLLFIHSKDIKPSSRSGYHQDANHLHERKVIIYCYHHSFPISITKVHVLSVKTKFIKENLPAWKNFINL